MIHFSVASLEFLFFWGITVKERTSYSGSAFSILKKLLLSAAQHFKRQNGASSPVVNNHSAFPSWAHRVIRIQSTLLWTDLRQHWRMRRLLWNTLALAEVLGHTTSFITCFIHNALDTHAVQIRMNFRTLHRARFRFYSPPREPHWFLNVTWRNPAQHLSLVVFVIII